MKIHHLNFILFWLAIALPNTQQCVSECVSVLGIGYVKIRIQFNELIFNSLSFLQQKLIDNTFTNEDMRKFYVLADFILRMDKKMNSRQQKENTVYWLLRQGR